MGSVYINMHKKINQLYYLIILLASVIIIFLSIFVNGQDVAKAASTVCYSDSQCSSGKICENGGCRPKISCALPNNNDQFCLKSEYGSLCTYNRFFNRNGICKSECSTDNYCEEKYTNTPFCSFNLGRCVECVKNSDCSSGEKCNSKGICAVSGSGSENNQTRYKECDYETQIGCGGEDFCNRREKCVPRGTLCNEEDYNCGDYNSLGIICTSANGGGACPSGKSCNGKGICESENVVSEGNNGTEGNHEDVPETNNSDLQCTLEERMRKSPDGCNCGDKCKEIAEAIEKYSSQSRIDPQLVAALMIQESHCNPAVGNSNDGATGLMQVTSKTWGDKCKNISRSFSEISGSANFEKNIQCGVLILKGKYNETSTGKRFFCRYYSKGKWYTVDKYYRGWDAALRGYNGWGCSVFSYTSQNTFVEQVNVKKQNLANVC